MDGMVWRRVGWAPFVWSLLFLDRLLVQTRYFPLFQVQCSWMGMGWCGGRVGTICGAWCGINARTAPCSAALNPNPLLTDCCLVAGIFLVKRRINLMTTVLMLMWATLLVKVELVRTVMLVAVRFPNPLYEVKWVGESDTSTVATRSASQPLIIPPGCPSDCQLILFKLQNWVELDLHELKYHLIIWAPSA